MDMLPMPDPILVARIKGLTFKKALENGVSGWPNFDGKWPIMSGCTFSFDPDKPKGEKINI